MKKRSRTDEILQLLGKTAEAEKKKMQKKDMKIPKSEIKVELGTTSRERENGNTASGTNLEKIQKRSRSEKKSLHENKNDIKEEGVNGLTVYLYPHDIKKLDEMVLYLVNKGRINDAYYTYVIRQAILKHEPGEWILDKSNKNKEGDPEAKTITLYNEELEKLNQYSAYFIKQGMIKEAKHSKIIRRMLRNLEPGEWLNN